MAAPALNILTESNPKRPNIFSYQDYKSFLRDYFDYLKASEPGFSVRKISLLAKISAGYLPTILNSEKDFTEKAVEKLIPHLFFSRNEASYFRALCSIKNSSSQEQRMEALKRLQRFEQFATLNPNEAMVASFFSKWYNVAIRAMADEPGFKFDPLWVQSRLSFPVPLAEVSKSLEFLLQNKLIKVNSDGSFSASDGNIFCDGKIYRYILTHFYKQTFSLATDAIDQVEKEKRNIRSHTACLSPDQFVEAKAIMDKAIDSIVELSRTTKNNASVYHFTSFAFPFSNPGDGEKK